MAALIAENDGPFKHHLDRFKYPDRFKAGDSRGDPRRDRDRELARDSGRDSPPNPDGDRQGHRAAALAILGRWNQRLQPGGWLLGPSACLADWALLPFVRQFRRADPAGFDAEPNLAALQNWLGRFEASAELTAVMETPWGQRQPWRSPHWLYHLALADEWRQARTNGVYARSTRGLGLEQVGFIHASYAHQLAATYARFYGDAGPVVLLTIDPGRLEQAGVAVRAEPGGSTPEAGAELFPHLYGPLPLTAVLTAAPYQP
jgi:glutathione S-transferase